jgi:hypothetical protein
LKFFFKRQYIQYIFSVAHEHDHEPTMIEKEMDEEISLLTEQVDVLQVDLEAAAGELEKLEKEKQEAEEARDQVNFIQKIFFVV